MKTDEFGKRLAHNLNRLPTEGGRVHKAVYVPHLQRLVVDTQQQARLEILEDNRRLYLERHKRYHERRDLAGGYPMRIPEYDLEILKQRYPEARDDAPMEDRNAFFKKLYRKHPEYRIG